MKYTTIISFILVLLTSCSPSKTVYITNKTGSPITLLIDTSYLTTDRLAFRDSLNGLRIENKKVFDYGKGKWTKEHKRTLEELVKHTKIIKDKSATAVEMPGKTKVSHISFTVEELWINIK